jgi:hypothetical protein
MAGLSSGRVNTANGLSNNIASSFESKIGFVYDVILDENNTYAKEQNQFSVFSGCIKFRTRETSVSSDKELPIAYPFDKSFKNLPIKNEIVEILKLQNGVFYYRRITPTFNPSVTATATAIKDEFAKDSNQKGSSENYNNVSVTGISNTNQSDDSKTDGFGQYYETQRGLHNLKLYEGDLVIEGRFGNTIRLSGYNNPQKKFSPSLIIRNNESLYQRTDKFPENQTVEEDFNRDGSIISLTSDQFELPFTPGTLSDKGSTDFETKPASFQNYPTKLIGDQILLNSGRIILSAKNAEMIFFSKKNYGFVSDGGMSIDNKLGIDVTVGDNINFVTNDKDIVFYTGQGSIFLGSTELEPLVKGQQLVDLLSELIDAITQQIYLTPSGPTAEGPTNLSQFGNIKSKLNNILSKLNQTS